MQALTMQAQIININYENLNNNLIDFNYAFFAAKLKSENIELQHVKTIAPYKKLISDELNIFLQGNKEILIICNSSSFNHKIIIDSLSKSLSLKLPCDRLRIEDEQSYFMMVKGDLKGINSLIIKPLTLISQNKEINQAIVVNLGHKEIILLLGQQIEEMFLEIKNELFCFKNDCLLQDHVHKEGINNAQLLSNLLLERNEKVSLAESMTAGLIASKLASLPGASQILSTSLVVYDKEAKRSILGIDEILLKEYDEVSKNIVIAMQKGLRKLSKSELLISITGYAGPTGADIGKVWGAFTYHHKTIIKKFKFFGKREDIREEAAEVFLANAYIIMNEVDYGNK